MQIRKHKFLTYEHYAPLGFNETSGTHRDSLANNPLNKFSFSNSSKQKTGNLQSGLTFMQSSTAKNVAKIFIVTEN